jgi:hypothetical protein
MRKGRPRYWIRRRTIVTRLTLAALLTLAVLLALAGPALAATPQDIYNDYADNGKLDGTYTDEELQAYLDDAVIQQYGDPEVVAALNALVQQMLSQAGEERSTFPFTGAQMAAVAAGALALLGGGLILRRTTPR